MTYPEYDMTAARNPRRWCRLLYLPVLPAGRMSSVGRYPPVYHQPRERKEPDMTTTRRNTAGPAQWQPSGAPSPSLAGTHGTSPHKARPGRAWYLLALAVFLGGAAWLVAGLLGVKGQVDAFQRVPVPQGGQVSLSHSGGYVLYYEAPGAASGQFRSFNVTVAPASPAARAQSLQPYSADVTYSFGSREGRAVLTLQVSHPGTFQVAAPGAPTVAGGSELAFGSGITGGIASTAVPAALLMGLGVAGGIALVITRARLAPGRRAHLTVPPTQPQAEPPSGPPTVP